MGIYRGPGGTGDAVNDAASEAVLVSQLVTQAQTSEANAANSATAASGSATTASTQATNASTSATNAATSASSASTSATNAASSASSASTSATNAASSASSASTSATSASGSASTATTQATNASNSASSASTSATNASNSASAAATSETNTATIYDNFDDRYLGNKSSNPTVDNDGNTLLTGALYFNTTVPEMRVWTGTIWQSLSTSGSSVTTFNTRSGDVTLSSSDVTTALTYTPLAPSTIGTTVQGYDADLQAIGALSGTSGLLKKTAANTWSLDTTSYSTTTGTVTSVEMTTPTGLTVTGSPVTTSGTLALTLTAGYSIPTTASQTNWDTAYTDRNKWDGGATGLTANTGRTSLGATTLGSNIFTITNPSAITFPRFNADNTISSLDAATFRTAIGAGTSSTTGTVTSITAGTGLSGGTITSSGTIAIDSTVTTNSGTQTLTNKRINPRAVAAGSTSGTLTPAGDTTDVFNAFGLTGAITVATPSGTPVDGQRLMLRFEDNGTGRGITWTTSSGAYRAVGVTLPTTTVASKITYVGCVYNSTDVFWDVIAVATQA